MNQEERIANLRHAMADYKTKTSGDPEAQRITIFNENLLKEYEGYNKTLQNMLTSFELYYGV